MFIIFELVHGRMFIHGFSHGLNIIQPIPRKVPIFLPVLWSPHWYPWIKLNMNGLSKRNSCPAACGGILRDCRGRFLGDFYQRISHGNYFLLILCNYY